MIRSRSHADVSSCHSISGDPQCRTRSASRLDAISDRKTNAELPRAKSTSAPH